MKTVLYSVKELRKTLIVIFSAMLLFIFTSYWSLDLKQTEPLEISAYNHNTSKPLGNRKETEVKPLGKSNELPPSKFDNVQDEVQSTEDDEEISTQSHSSIQEQREAQLVDWINHTFLELEAARRGPGEQGLPVSLTSKTEKVAAEKVIQEYSHNGVASDKISLNRALPDDRSFECQSLKYRADLPPVSVIIIFHNEYLSNLLRTVHSVINRTPERLLAEVLLVDDFSDKDFLKTDLEKQVNSYRPDKVRIIRMKERSGLMKTRMEGIRQAQSDIVVVMDGHMEVITGWLPPLIEPIVEDYRTLTEPTVITIDHDTLAVQQTPIWKGNREGFEWSLLLQWLDVNLKEDDKNTDNIRNPAILGAIMAINKTFFWELGGYDDQLRIWGGEQYDISFKVWMCGDGQVLTVPCSIVGHNFKSGGHHPFFKADDGEDPYYMHNIKRIVEVYFDEPHKQFFYSMHPAYEKVAVGNLSKQLEMKKRLQCKSFQWYLDTVFPDFLQKWPMNVTRVASGLIMSRANPNQCVDTLQRKDQFGLYPCSSKDSPSDTQNFVFTPNFEIRTGLGAWECIDAFESFNNLIGHGLHQRPCHGNRGNQEFRFEQDTGKIKQGNYCLDIQSLSHSQEDQGIFPLVIFTECSESVSQQWDWSLVNQDLYKELKMARHELIRNQT